MDSFFSRRKFLKTTLAGAVAGALGWRETGAAASPPAVLPKRTLGKTGVQVPILGYGTAQTGTERSLEEAVRLFHQAVEMGVNYFDTAPEFSGYGKAQVQLGHAFRDRRAEVFLTTKCAQAKGDEAFRVLKESLKQMQTDYIDLLYLHSLGADELDVKVATGPGGVLEFLQKAKADGLARFIGVTGHNRPDRFLPILKDYEIDVMMNSVNFVDRHTYNFEEKVWPEAARRNVGLVAMKVFGGSQTTNNKHSRLATDHHSAAFRYALSLPGVACAVIGMQWPQELERNVAWAKSFTSMTEREMTELAAVGKRMAAEWKDHLGKVV